MNNLYRILHILGAMSLAIYIYGFVNEWSYNTVFLPYFEGVITAGFLTVFIFFRSALLACEQKKYTYTPWIIVATLVVFLMLLASQGLPVKALVAAFFFPLGGLGIPLGYVIYAVFPFILPTSFLFVLPVLSLCVYLKQLTSANLFRLDKYLFDNILFPILSLVFGFALFFLLLQVKTNEIRENNLSYESGRKIQEVLESYYRQNGNYPENFADLIEQKYYQQPPASPVDDRVYTYRVDSDLQNYTICFPRHNGEQCERSWSK